LSTPVGESPHPLASPQFFLSSSSSSKRRTAPSVFVPFVASCHRSTFSRLKRHDLPRLLGVTGIRAALCWPANELELPCELERNCGGVACTESESLDLALPVRLRRGLGELAPNLRTGAPFAASPVLAQGVLEYWCSSSTSSFLDLRISTSLSPSASPSAMHASQHTSLSAQLKQAPVTGTSQCICFMTLSSTLNGGGGGGEQKTNKKRHPLFPEGTPAHVQPAASQSAARCPRRSCPGPRPKQLQFATAPRCNKACWAPSGTAIRRNCFLCCFQIDWWVG
jgi:hypothetical protein